MSLVAQSGQGIVPQNLWLWDTPPKVLSKSEPFYACPGIASPQNSVAAVPGKSAYCLGRDFHVAGGSARRQATVMGCADVEGPEDAGLGLKDGFAAPVAVAAGRGERVDPRIPSSSMTWVRISRQRQRDSMGVLALALITIHATTACQRSGNTRNE